MICNPIGKIQTALALCCAALAIAIPSEAQETTGVVVAVVNGVPLHASDVVCFLEASTLPIAIPFAAEPGGEQDRPDLHSALNRLITLELLYQESLRHRYPGLTIEAEERYRHEVERLGGEARLQAALRCNDMTPEAFRRALFRNLSINRYLEDHVFSRIVVGDQEVSDYYDRHKSEFLPPAAARVCMIFLRVQSWEDASRVKGMRTRADQIRSMAVSGGDFEALARRFSEDPAGAARGGDIGIVLKGDRRFPFEKEVFSMEVGDVSDPIATRKGFYILKVVERPPVVPAPLPEVRDRIVSRLRQEKAAVMVAELVTGLRSTADIRVVQSRIP